MSQSYDEYELQDFVPHAKRVLEKDKLDLFSFIVTLCDFGNMSVFTFFNWFVFFVLLLGSIEFKGALEFCRFAIVFLIALVFLALFLRLNSTQHYCLLTYFFYFLIKYLNCGVIEYG
jgi:hypothetical protein